MKPGRCRSMRSYLICGVRMVLNKFEDNNCFICCWSYRCTWCWNRVGHVVKEKHLLIASLFNVYLHEQEYCNYKQHKSEMHRFERGARLHHQRRQRWAAEVLKIESSPPIRGQKAFWLVDHFWMDVNSFPKGLKATTCVSWSVKYQQKAWCVNLPYTLFLKIQQRHKRRHRIQEIWSQTHWKSLSTQLVYQLIKLPSFVFSMTYCCTWLVFRKIVRANEAEYEVWIGYMLCGLALITATTQINISNH